MAAMRYLSFSIFTKALICTAASFIAAISSAKAATITFSGQPVITPATNITADGGNSFSISQIDSKHVKASGSGTYTYNGSGSGNTITLTIGGSFQVAGGEDFYGNYDFTLGVTGSGSVHYDITASANLTSPLPASGTVYNDSGDLASGTQQFTGSGSYIAPNLFSSYSGNWSASVVLTWLNATPGDTLTFTVPQNSIDFLVATPEPSSVALIGCGLLALAYRRVRR